MGLLAIANISNGINTIGFRLLDVNTGQIKDVSIDDVKNIVGHYKKQIENLTIKDNIIVGSNGSIERLPKIINGQLVGKSPLIVISQLDNVRYLVSDFNGTIKKLSNQDVITYSEINGIANGKIISKAGKKFISAIEGSYIREELKLSETKENIKYTGEELKEEKKLLPILISDITEEFRLKPKYTIISYENEKIIKKHLTNIGIAPSKDDILKDAVYHTNEYTLGGKLYRVLHYKYEKHRKDMLELMQTKRYREIVSYPVRAVSLSYIIDDTLNGIKDTSGYTKKEASELLKCEKTLCARTLISYKKLLLSRECTNKGIVYKELIFDTKGIYSINTTTIEEVHNSIDEYDNIVEEDGKIKVIGLDGVYKYDMDKIYNTYKRKVIKTKQALKASIIDPTYKEIMNEAGELKLLRSSLEFVKLPINTQVIIEKAIELNNKTKGIAFGENIKDCSTKCLQPESYSGHNLQYVEIGCSTKAGIGILHSLDNCISMHNRKITLKYTRDISPEEYATARNMEKWEPIIHANNLNNPTEQFILQYIKYSIKYKIKNIKYINNYIKMSTNKAAEELRISVKKLENDWENKFKPFSSESTIQKAEILITELKAKVREWL